MKIQVEVTQVRPPRNRWQKVGDAISFVLFLFFMLVTFGK